MLRTTRPSPRSFHRLLVGTDFSPGATRALTRVPRLPLAPGAEISLLHVMAGWLNPTLLGRQVREAENRLRHAACDVLVAPLERAQKPSGRRAA